MDFFPIVATVVNLIALNHEALKYLILSAKAYLIDTAHYCGGLLQLSHRKFNLNHSHPELHRSQLK